jgi:hypothetical protein
MTSAIIYMYSVNLTLHEENAKNLEKIKLLEKAISDIKLAHPPKIDDMSLLSAIYNKTIQIINSFHPDPLVLNVIIVTTTLVVGIAIADYYIGGMIFRPLNQMIRPVKDFVESLFRGKGPEGSEGSEMLTKTLEENTNKISGIETEVGIIKDALSNIMKEGTKIDQSQFIALNRNIHEAFRNTLLNVNNNNALNRIIDNESLVDYNDNTFSQLDLYGAQDIVEIMDLTINSGILPPFF